jgi:hypothetical protein
MANRETQVSIVGVVTGSPSVRATQASAIVVQGGSPNGRLTQCAVIVIVPNIPNTVPPLNEVYEFVMP